MPAVRSGLLTAAQLESFEVARFSSRCPGCANSCPVQVADFGNGKQIVSENRCGKANAYRYAQGETAVPREGKGGHNGRDAAGDVRKRRLNAVAAEQRLLSAFDTVDGEGPRSTVRIGVMNCFETLPSSSRSGTRCSRTSASASPSPTTNAPAQPRNSALATVPAEGVRFPAKVGAYTPVRPGQRRGKRSFHARVRPIRPLRGVNRIRARAARCGTEPAGERIRLRCIAPHLHSFKASRITENPDDTQALRDALQRWSAQPTHHLKQKQLRARHRRGNVGAGTILFPGGSGERTRHGVAFRKP